jgi:hypothetical protein
MRSHALETTPEKLPEQPEISKANSNDDIDGLAAQINGSKTFNF